MNKDRLQFYAYLTITALGIGIVAFLFFKYLFVALLPFIISWAAAFFLRPAVRFISQKIGVPHKIVSVILTMICVVLTLGLLSLFCFFAVREAWEFFSSLASDDRIIDILAKITNPIGSIFGDSEVSSALTEEIGGALREGISGLVNRLVNLLSKIVSMIPGVLFFILVTVIASVYFALDIDRINAWVKSVLPGKAVGALLRLKKSAMKIGVKYIRSYLIIMGITFVIILAGLLILGVDNVILLSVIIAILDLLPIIGVGTVLVPWSIFELLMGNTGVGVGLIILLAVHELVRQFAEPKIIGKSIGVHPVISLLLLYVGYYALGFIGILFVPLLAVALNIFFDKRERESSSEENHSAEVD